MHVMQEVKYDLPIFAHPTKTGTFKRVRLSLDFLFSTGDSILFILHPFSETGHTFFHKADPTSRYIKELADRVTTLERERQANGLDGNSPQPTGPALNQEDINFLSGVADATFTATPIVAGQKRSHSISEGFNDQYTSRERGGVPPEELVSIDENDFNS